MRTNKILRNKQSYALTFINNSLLVTVTSTSLVFWNIKTRRIVYEYIYLQDINKDNKNKEKNNENLENNKTVVLGVFNVTNKIVLHLRGIVIVYDLEIDEIKIKKVFKFVADYCSFCKVCCFTKRPTSDNADTTSSDSDWYMLIPKDKSISLLKNSKLKKEYKISNYGLLMSLYYNFYIFELYESGIVIRNDDYIISNIDSFDKNICFTDLCVKSLNGLDSSGSLDSFDLVVCSANGSLCRLLVTSEVAKEVIDAGASSCVEFCGEFVVLGCWDGSLCVYSLTSDEKNKGLKLEGLSRFHEKRINNVGVFENCFGVCSGDGLVSLWDLSK